MKKIILINILIKLLNKFFQKIFLEDFNEIIDKYEKEFKSKPKYVLTQNLYDPEEKLIYLALMQIKKTKLFFQHGGLYGTHLFHTGELTEMMFLLINFLLGVGKK